MTTYPNWFDVAARQVFEEILPQYVGKEVNFLQIGAYTGDATEWLLNNVVMTGKRSTLTDVDTWAGSDEEIHRTFDWSDVEAHYTNRFSKEIESKRLRKIKTTSDAFFSRNKDGYDFIYIDGDHTAEGMNAYTCLKPNGIVAFDDYLWEPGLPAHLTPKLAINVIASIYQGRLEVIHAGYQVWFRKIS